MPRYEDDYRRAYHRAYQESVVHSTVWQEPKLHPEGYTDLLKPNLTRWEHVWLAIFMALAVINTPPQSGPSEALLCITWIVTCGWLFGRLLLWAYARWGDVL